MILRIMTRIPGCRNTGHSSEARWLAGQLARERSNVIANTQMLRIGWLFHKLIEGTVQGRSVDAQIDAVLKYGLLITLRHLMDMPNSVLKSANPLRGAVPVDGDQFMYDEIGSRTDGHTVLEAFHILRAF